MAKTAKKQAKHALYRVKTVKTLQLAIVLLPLLVIAATLLRNDHIKMTELRAAVVEADAEGDDEKVIAALTELQDFTFTHIVINIVENNGEQLVTFGTGPFYLEQSYRRAANAAIAAAEGVLADDSNPNGNIYLAVQQICQPQAIQNGWEWSNPNYLECWTTELAKYPAMDALENTIVADVPSTDLYRREYASPVWAPTATGWILLICAILALVILVRFAIWLILKVCLIFT